MDSLSPPQCRRFEGKDGIEETEDNRPMGGTDRKPAYFVANARPNEIHETRILVLLNKGIR